MAVLADFETKVGQSVQDTAGKVDAAATIAFIQQAVRQYSKDRPRIRDAEFTGDAILQEFPVPAGWIKGFSTMQTLEFPVDEVPIRRRDLQDNLVIVQKGDVEKVQLIFTTLAVAEKARVTYTALHTVDAGTSTIQDTDFDAVSDLAAHYVCLALAGFYQEETDSALAVDVVAGASRADGFRAQAASLMKTYIEHMTESEVETGALFLHDQDLRFVHGTELLMHPERFR